MSGYQFPTPWPRAGLPRNLYVRPTVGAAVSPPRAFLVLLGIAFLVAAVVIASFDRLLGLGAFIVGAFLLVLPFLAIHEDG